MVKIAMDLLREGKIDEKTVLKRMEPEKLDELLHPVFDASAMKTAKVVAKGLPASPGAATGHIVFFADDAEALAQKYEYMFGPSLLISPVTEPNVTEWRTYLPKNKDGWTDYRTGRHYRGGQYITTPVDKAHIPVFVRGNVQTITQ